MSYFSQWQKILTESGQSPEADEAVKLYYEMETAAYEIILNQHEKIPTGKASELAEQLGFSHDMVTFLGFLDGINSSLASELDLEAIDDDTEVTLTIDFRRLYLQMHEAKAEWLFGLKAWDKVLTPEEQLKLTKEYRTSKIVRHEKIGRNDPCPCGSGKKYKNCCGREA